MLLPIWGFFVGFWLAGWAVTQLFGHGLLATEGGLVAGLVLGIGLATLSYFSFRVGVVLVAGGFAAALASGALAAVGMGTGSLGAIVPIAVGILVVILALQTNLQKYTIILLTALAGADALVLAAMLLLGQVSLLSLEVRGNLIEPILETSPVWLLVGLVLAVAGVLIQVRFSRHYVYRQNRVMERWS
jgi:hypothetical protein